MSVISLERQEHFKFEEGITTQKSWERLKCSELLLAFQETPIFMAKMKIDGAD